MKTKIWVYNFFKIMILWYIIILLLNFFVDPKMEYHKEYNNKKFSINREYSKKQYELLKSNSYTLVFGTSRTSIWSSKMLNRKVLNFHNIYGEPGEIYNFLSQLNSNQIKNIEKIYYLLDVHTIKDETVSYIDYNDTSFNYASLFKIDFNKIKSIFYEIYYFIHPAFTYYINNDGSIEHIHPKKHMGNYIPTPAKTDKRFEENAIQTIIKINKLCIKHNIDIVYITPTFVDTRLYNIEINSLQYFLSKLLKNGISQIYSLYFINGISNLKDKNNNYLAFRNAGHLNFFYYKKIFKEIILKEDKAYIIYDIKSLKRHIQQIKNINTKTEKQFKKQRINIAIQ